MFKKYKFSCTITGDLDSGDYEAIFKNISSPGDDIEYSDVKDFLQKVLKDLENTEETDERFVKLIN